MNNKTKLSNLLRRFKLIFVADKINYYVNQFKNKSKNKKFIQENPDVLLPPDYLIYESFHLDYYHYYNGGKKTAVWLSNKFSNFIKNENIKILDWGCGPARVVRHFPNILPSAEIYATDYNPQSIEWNRANIKSVNFNLNFLEADLPYENNFFDVIYGISIFTHLSEEKHYEWAKELTRILKPGGILFLTFQGEAFKQRLSESEIKVFDKGKIVVRDKVKEGHRTFSAFHPDAFVVRLFKDLDVVEHNKSFLNNTALEQDSWIFRKLE